MAIVLNIGDKAGCWCYANRTVATVCSNGRWWVDCRPGSRVDHGASSRDSLPVLMTDQGRRDDCSMRPRRDDPCSRAAGGHCSPSHLAANRDGRECSRYGSLDHRKRHTGHPCVRGSSHTRCRSVRCSSWRNHRQHRHQLHRMRWGEPDRNCNFRCCNCRLHRMCSHQQLICADCDEGSRLIRPTKPQELRP